MAVPGTLLLKAKALLASIDATAVPDDNIVYFLNNGARFAVNSLPYKLSDLWTDYILSATNPVEILDRATGEAFTIIHVHRGVYVAKEIEDEQRYSNTLNTFLAATNVFPQWYRDRNNVYVQPDPGASPEDARVAVIQIPEIVTATEKFHQGLENAVIYYAVSLSLRVNIDYVLMQLSNEIALMASNTLIEAEMPNISAGDKTLVVNALANAEKFMVSGGVVTTQKSAGGYVVEEDSEMVEANIASARGEIERALALVKSLIDQNSVYAQKINSVASALASAAQSVQTLYQSATTYMAQAMAEVQTYIANSSPQPVMQQPQEEENK